ncbi:hypothetical protein L9F63_016896, partial [Diploptera punctata]
SCLAYSDGYQSRKFYNFISGSILILSFWIFLTYTFVIRKVNIIGYVFNINSTFNLLLRVDWKNTSCPKSDDML